MNFQDMGFWQSDWISRRRFKIVQRTLNWLFTLTKVLPVDCRVSFSAVSLCCPIMQEYILDGVVYEVLSQDKRLLALKKASVLSPMNYIHEVKILGELQGEPNTIRLIEREVTEMSTFLVLISPPVRNGSIETNFAVYYILRVSFVASIFALSFESTSKDG